MMNKTILVAATALRLITAVLAPSGFQPEGSAGGHGAAVVAENEPHSNALAHSEYRGNTFAESEFRSNEGLA